MTPQRLLILVSVGLFALTAAAFGHTCGYGFVSYDDPDYVFLNPYVRMGLTGESIRWAFTTFHAANWHPLTWLSLQLDWELYGGRPWGFHLTNVLLHAGNGVLLFLALQRMTQAMWRSAFVAALFALHPLHVESVAWVTERKDVLSTSFGFLSLLAYAAYAEKPGVGRYLAVAAFLALGLMAKPLLVTWPFVMLLLDYWPLGRWRFQGERRKPQMAASDQVTRCRGDKVTGPPPGRPFTLSRFHLAMEKLPLLALSFASSVITLHAQGAGQAVHSLADTPMWLRVGNALVSYCTYLWKTVWPTELAILYPHPYGALLVWQMVAAGGFLGTITLVVLKLIRRLPYLAVGWFWYLGTLVPMIGFVQVGLQALADRYTYVPLIGIFIALAWGASDLAARWQLREVTAVLGGAMLVGCTLLTWLQVHYWRDNYTLWNRAFEVAKAANVMESPSASVICNNLGLAYLEKNKPYDSLELLRQAVRLNPGYLDGRLNLGVILLAKGDAPEAEQQFRCALEIIEAEKWGGASAEIKANHQLGLALVRQGRWQKAVRHFRRAVDLQPDFVPGRCFLGLALEKAGRTAEAAAQYHQAVELDPQWPEKNNRDAWTWATHADRGRRNGRLALEAAEQACQATGRRDPAFLDTLAAAHAEAGQFHEAVGTAREALARAGASGRIDLARSIQQRLALYEQRKPFRDGPAAGPR